MMSESCTTQLLVKVTGRASAKTEMVSTTLPAAVTYHTELDTVEMQAAENTPLLVFPENSINISCNDIDSAQTLSETR